MGVAVGLTSTAVAVGVGELVAAFVRPAAAPVIAVGNRVIVLTPESAKDATVQAAGTNDKLVLLVGIYLLLAAFGAVVGLAALRRLRLGVAGVLLVGAVGAYCALTANAGRPSDVVPTVFATAASLAVLVVLVRLAGGAGQQRDVHLPSRRAFLQAGAASTALAAVAGFGGRAEQHARFDVAASRSKVRLPTARSGTGSGGSVPAGTDLGVSGVPWRTSSADFYRIDTALAVPQIDPKSWRLRIHGMVDRPITLSYDDLLARPLVDRWVTLCCVSNEVGGDLVGNALWRGALLADVLRAVGVQAASDQLVLRSADGMTIGAPTRVVMDGRDALLAVGMNGRPLPVEHGFPVRTVVPGLYGYVSACKWIVDIEATTFAGHAAYWVEKGWKAQLPIETAARMDRPSASQVVSVGEPVAIAGVAWDQHVGIAKVEVQVDDEPWRAARLATVPSTDTWRQWVCAWTPEKSGDHRLRVRAVDARGRVQDPARHEPFPGAASGLHTITVHAVV